MITTMSIEREKMAHRMQTLCDLLGFPKEKRQTLLARKYKKSITTGRNWLLGLKIPDYETALAMCNDAGVNYEWLMTGNGLMMKSSTDDSIVVSDKELIKMVRIAEDLPGFAKQMAIKEVDNIRQFAAQAQEEYAHKK